MIYNFRIVSDEVDNFKREIQIDADATFLDLRNAICDSVGYDKTQFSSFFMCDEGWEREQEICLEDMGSDSSQDVYLMEDTPLSDFIEDEGQRLVWVFDYLTDRSFFLEMKRSVPANISSTHSAPSPWAKPPHSRSTWMTSMLKSTPRPPLRQQPTSTTTSTARPSITKTSLTPQDLTK